MKKITIALLLASSSLLTAPVFAQHGGFDTQDSLSKQGGFKGPNIANASVHEAKGMRDDTWVVLEGNIIRKMGKELYEFRDESGSINVEIDDHIWQGLTAGPKDRVRIEGEVDKDWNSVEIDVKRISKP